MKTTPTAAAFTTTPEALPTLLAGYGDKELDVVESWAKAVVAGRDIRITHHTPRGFVLSKTCGERVLKAVRVEQTKRCGF